MTNAAMPNKENIYLMSAKMTPLLQENREFLKEQDNIEINRLYFDILASDDFLVSWSNHSWEDLSL